MSTVAPFSFQGTGRDRDHDLRADPAALQRHLDQDAPVLALWRGQPLVAITAQPDAAEASASEVKLVWLPISHPIFAAASSPIYLGKFDNKAVFAADISHFTPEEGAPLPDGFDAGCQYHPQAPAGSALWELRQIMSRLSPDEAELAATARALCEWHRRHGFCPSCGQATLSAGAGWRRDCPSCKAQHFPRTDPVVIMLVLHGDRALIGRSPGWPTGMYSTLAGFIEPGETLETAVRREVHEETGILCSSVRYIASQPWPFPANLMLGCVAQAETDAINLDPVELEDAFWISRADMTAAFAGDSSKMKLPRPGSIARYLLESWIADRLA